jgi:tetratricopeptide (TPR) repeat protein
MTMTLVGMACVGAAAIAYWLTAKFVAPTPSPSQKKENHLSAAPSNSLSSTTAAVDVTQPDPGPVEFNTNDAVQVLNRGTQLLTAGKIPEAIELYERAATLNPDDEEAYFNLGVAFSRLARLADAAKRTNDAVIFFDEAVRRYNEALRIFPEHAEAHNNLGNLLLERRHYNEALAHYSAAIRANPDHSSAINNLGKCLALQGKTEDALAQFHEAVRLNTNYVEARFNLANACILLGRFDEAVSQLEQVLRLAPEFEMAARRLADAKAKKATAGK